MAKTFETELNTHVYGAVQFKTHFDVVKYTRALEIIRKADALIQAQRDLIEWHMDRLGLAILPQEVATHDALVQKVLDAGGEA